MKPERAVRIVTWWTRTYSRSLPPPIAERRRAEISSDLHEHVAHERAEGVREVRIAFRVLSRLLRGMPADVSWLVQMRAREGSVMRPSLSTIATAGVPALIGIAAIVFGQADDAPGLVMLGLLLIAGGLAFALKPSLRRAPRFFGVICAAVILAALGSGLAGWLENRF